MIIYRIAIPMFIFNNQNNITYDAKNVSMVIYLTDSPAKSCNKK